MKRLRNIYLAIIGRISAEWINELCLDQAFLKQKNKELTRALEFAQVGVRDLKHQIELLGGEKQIKKLSDDLGEAAIRGILHSE